MRTGQAGGRRKRAGGWLAAWLTCVWLAACATLSSVAPSAPFDLRTEYAEEPLGLDVARPRLSWKSGVAAQTAYQVVVSVAGATVWDSGRVASRESVLLPYGGPELKARTRYQWQVRVWDVAGNASAWSAPGWWEMGLLSAADWSARWIAGPERRDHEWGDFALEVDLTLKGAYAEILFRARPVGKTYGEAYAWRLMEDAAGAALVQTVRRYPGGSSSTVKISELGRVALAGISLRNKRRNVTIEARGDTITTSIDGAVVATVKDAQQARGAIGFWSREAQAAVIHGVRVAPIDAGQAFTTTFAANDNAFTGGRVTADGLLIPAGVPGVDIMLPMEAPAPLLRRTFYFGGREVASARLYVAGAGWPRLALNGVAIGRSAMGVGFTAYDKRVPVYTYDVGELLKRGENVLGAELGRGWYGITDPNEWYFQSAPWRGEPAIRAQLEIVFADGAREVIATDGSWQTVSGPTLGDSVHRGERYDARLAQGGWDRAGFSAAGWGTARIVTGPRGALVAANAEEIAPVGDPMTAVSLNEVAPDVWVYDFGRILSGWTELTVAGEAGRTVSLVASERIDNAGDVVPAAGLIDAQLQTDRYTLAGGGTERWAPRFGYRGFRYVRMEGFPGAPTLRALTAQAVHSDVARIGAFESANPLLQSIDAAGLNTILNNLHGYITDTPTYEKNGWTGDAQGSAGAVARSLDVSRVWTKWLADFRDAQAANGEIPEIVPATPDYGYENTPGWNYVWGPTTAWDVATLILPWELYQTHGDTRILEEMHDAQVRLVDYTARVIGDDYFHNTGLSEWSSPGGADIANVRGGGIDAVATAYFFLEADLLAKSSAVIGRAEEAQRFRRLADAIREAYNARYWDKAAGHYRTMGKGGAAMAPTQTQNVLPLAFGMTPVGGEQGVADWLATDVAANGMRTGVFGTRYLLDMLSDHGHVDVAYALAISETEPSWGWWIANGHSTMFERWDLGSRSRDHHYFSSISDWMRQRIGGLRAAEPGYRIVRVKPEAPFGLAHASASFETPYGRAASAWRVADGRMSLTAVIPPNTTGEVWVPLAFGAVTRAPAGAVRSATHERHAVYVVGPGSHVFATGGAE